MHYIRDHGVLPTHLRNRENKNVAPEALIEYADIIKEFKAPAIPTLEQHLVFVDGFMMYVNEDLINAFDIRLMLVTDFDTLKRRREARTGYITLEGKNSTIQIKHNTCV